MQPPRNIHVSVLIAAAIRYLMPTDGGIYVDGTLGLGGHARAILDACGPNGRLIGFDWDADALKLARRNLDAYGDRLLTIRGNFAGIKDGLEQNGITAVNGILLDLGLSSLQLEKSGRGFSFRGDEPLDMRMDDRRKQTAADLINTSNEEDLANLFYEFGEERQSRRIAALIVTERKKEWIRTTGRLAKIVADAVPKRFHPKKIDPATRVFQALRIAVNREMENLVTVLESGVHSLKPGGRFVVISFHSLEDRVVKRAFRQHPDLRVLTKKPVVPDPEECRTNPRARSAKLRAAEKIGPDQQEAEK